MNFRDLIRISLDPLAGASTWQPEPTPKQVRRYRFWQALSTGLGVVATVALVLYWVTNLLPERFGYVLGPLGLTAWWAMIQARASLSSPPTDA